MPGTMLKGDNTLQFGDKCLNCTVALFIYSTFTRDNTEHLLLNIKNFEDTSEHPLAQTLEQLHKGGRTLCD